MSEQQKLTRQEIYERIRESSKDEFILSEMVRLGFWQQNKDKPELSEQFLARRLELQKKLRELGQSYRLYQDPEKALKELHKERKKKALEKREQTKQANNQRRHERALAWHNKQQTAIHYIGDGYSFGLQKAEQNGEKLDGYGLPRFDDSKAMADAIGISLNELRFLCFQKDVSQINHYQQFEIAKKTGGVRKISAPMPRLKRAQYWLLDNVLNKVKIHDAAHGFVTGRSILTNALPHVKKAVVINLDLENFFPTISYRRVKGMFLQLGYSETVATLMALLSTEPETDVVNMDNETWYVQQGERFLPQGAPTSPAVTNIICRRLDSRLSSMAAKLGFSYSRYADDMTFSSDKTDNVQQLLWRCKQIIKDEGFIIHPQKTRIMRCHQKQEVTGVVVNEKPSIDRETLKRFRALLFQMGKDGIEGKRWGCGELMASIDGYANFVAMIAPEKGLPLQNQIAELKQKHGYQVKPGRISELNRKLFRAKAAAGNTPREKWWNAQPVAAPELEKTSEQKAAERQAARQQAKAEQAQNNAATAQPQAASTQQARSSQAQQTSQTPQPERYRPLSKEEALLQKYQKIPIKTRYRVFAAAIIIAVLSIATAGIFGLALLIAR